MILQLNQEKIEVLSLRTRKIITLSGFIIDLMIRIVHFHQGNNRGKTLRYKAFIIIIFPQKQLPCFHSSSLVLTESQKSRFPCQDIGQDKRKNIYNLQFPVEWNLELQIKICTYYRYMISSSSPSVVFDSNHLTIMLLISLLSHDIYRYVISFTVYIDFLTMLTINTNQLLIITYAQSNHLEKKLRYGDVKVQIVV